MEGKWNNQRRGQNEDQQSSVPVLARRTGPERKKVYSLFEDHTELLKRGKAGKPIEFGHKVLVAQTAEKFIHHHQVLPRRKEDTELLTPTLKAHRKLFGDGPDVLAADKGFKHYAAGIGLAVFCHNLVVLTQG